MSSSSAPDEVVRIQLPEVIDEHLDMVQLFGPPRPTFIVDCAAVKRINSVGVRSLKSTLNRLKTDGGKFIFEKLTPSFVETLEFVSNMLPPNTKITSVYLPYQCVDCGQPFLVLHTFEEVSRGPAGFETAPCPKCGKEVGFDHMPEVYFRPFTAPSPTKR